jgi:NTP pyrophosphatase (non-canonical NTP hydrolase)
MPVYPFFGLAGEVGEVMEKMKKCIRDGTPRTELREFLKKELGDVLWYINALAHEFDLTLEEIAIANVEKLESRKARDQLHGSGDDR